jgi:hypothetical protein
MLLIFSSCLFTFGLGKEFVVLPRITSLDGFRILPITDTAKLPVVNSVALIVPL